MNKLDIQTLIYSATSRVAIQDWEERKKGGIRESCGPSTVALLQAFLYFL
jgi:hypothetical protein